MIQTLSESSVQDGLSAGVGCVKAEAELPHSKKERAA